MLVLTSPSLISSYFKAVRLKSIGCATPSGPPSYASGGSGVVWQQFQILRQTYPSFKATLTSGQLNAGANGLAELDAGLDVLQQAFDEYHQDVAAGRSQTKAFQSMCMALDKGAVVWLEELKPRR